MSPAAGCHSQSRHTGSRLLIERCSKYHSGDKPKGGLRLDSREALMAGGVVKTMPPDTKTLVRMNAAMQGTLRSLPEADVLFLALHGGQGEDGRICL